MSQTFDDRQANPFALMLNPEQVISAMERSDQLRHLKLRRLRPLDRPWIPLAEPEVRERARQAMSTRKPGLAA